ncbi:MAG: hypothetical protein EOP04_08610, partial [Proteobacteria bacterium]
MRPIAFYFALVIFPTNRLSLYSKLSDLTATKDHVFSAKIKVLWKLILILLICKKKIFWNLRPFPKKVVSFACWIRSFVLIRCSRNSCTNLTLGIGQDMMQATPLQLANAMCIIANKGFFFTPHFVSRIDNEAPADSV